MEIIALNIFDLLYECTIQKETISNFSYYCNQCSKYLIVEKKNVYKIVKIFPLTSDDKKFGFVPKKIQTFFMYLRMKTIIIIIKV